MLDELSGLVDGSDGLRVFAILLLPNSILLVAGSFLLSECALITFDIFDGLSDIRLSLFKSLGVIVTHLGVGGYLALVVSDSVLEVGGNTVTSSNVNSAYIIVFILIFNQTSDNLVQ